MDSDSVTWDTLLARVSNEVERERIQKILPQKVGSPANFIWLGEESQHMLMTGLFGEYGASVLIELKAYKAASRKWMSLIKTDINPIIFVAPAYLHLVNDAADDKTILYVRDCYKELATLIFDSTAKYIGLTGNPGIGKTFFGIYFLLLAVITRGRTVVYHRVSPYVISPSSISKFKEGSLLSVDYYILDVYAKDTVKVAINSGKIIYIYSPAAFDKNWGLDKGQHLNMPVWSKHEIEVLQGYNKFNKEEMEANYAIFGGIPRYIFCSKSAKNVNVHRIEEKIFLTDIKKFAGVTDHTVSHLIFHRDNEPGQYEKYTLKLASEYIKGYIFDHATEMGRANVIQFLQHSHAIPMFGTIRGKLFESFAHVALSNGQTFNRIKLADTTRDKITFARKEYSKYYYDDVISTKSLDEAYWVPHSEKHQTVDSMAENNLFQMTIKDKRDLKLAKVKEIKDRFFKKDDDIINFYFVVPKDIFEHFTLSNFISRWGKIDWVTFYVLEIVIEHNIFGI